MASHHMIVYRDNMDTAEMPTPFDCQPFNRRPEPERSGPRRW